MVTEKYALYCFECGTEIIRNELLLRCPTCNVVDFTEQGEARFPALVQKLRERYMNVKDFRDILDRR